MQEPGILENRGIVRKTDAFTDRPGSLPVREGIVDTDDERYDDDHDERQHRRHQKEELGDLLLQVMFHSVIAQEEGLFTFDDVAATINEKMIRRHPHVFGGVNFASDEERHKAWEEIKKKEKAGKEWQVSYLEEAMKESKELINKAQQRKGFNIE